jgi:hypothetical protein
MSGFLGVPGFLLRRQPLLYGNGVKQLPWFYAKSVRKLEEAGKGNRLLRALYPSDLVPVEVTHLRQLLLGEMPFNPQLSDLSAE